MRSDKSIWLDGKTARSLSARVLTVSEYAPPKKRLDEYVIPGRDGIVTRWDGSYEPVIVTVRYQYEKYLSLAALTGIAKLGVGKHAEGAGRLEYTVIKSEAEMLEYVRGGWHTVSVTYTCEPRAKYIGAKSAGRTYDETIS